MSQVPGSPARRRSIWRTLAIILLVLIVLSIIYVAFGVGGDARA